MECAGMPSAPGLSQIIFKNEKHPRMTTQQKFRRTFVAMFRGWLVCNLVSSTFFSLWIAIEEGSLASKLQYMGLYLVMSLLYSGIIITIAWLFILYPTDLLVHEASPLRKPRNAALCGAAGGFMSIILLKYMFWAGSSNGGHSFWEDSIWIVPFGLLAAITGLTAALHIVLKHPRIPIPTTKN
jgi:hypothetical protein